MKMIKQCIALTVCLIIFANFTFPGIAYAQFAHTLGGFEGAGGYTIATGEQDISVVTNRFEDLLSNVVGTLTLVAGLYFLIMFIVGGLSWAGAGGKTDKVEEAKQRMTNAAIGLIIVVAAYSITFIIGRILGIRFLEPGTVIQQLGPAASQTTSQIN
jgi:hypothetical protein